MPNTCPGCASSNPADFDDSNGSLVCTNCGTVLNDSQIVSEISFGEKSSGAAIVQGSYVAEGQTHVGGGGKFRSGTSLESREQAIGAGESFRLCLIDFHLSLFFIRSYAFYSVVWGFPCFPIIVTFVTPFWLRFMHFLYFRILIGSFQPLRYSRCTSGCTRSKKPNTNDLFRSTKDRSASTCIELP